MESALQAGGMAAGTATFVPACDAGKAAMSSLEELRVSNVLRCHALVRHVWVCHKSMHHDCLAYELKSSM